MKHIRKRFFFEREAKNFMPDPSSFEEIKIEKGLNKDYLKDKNGAFTLIYTDKNILIGGLVHNVNGKNYAFPVPDPTLVYFNYAQNSIKVIEKCRESLLLKVELGHKLSEPAINEIYAYYSVTSGFVIFLFTSIESFINSLVPKDYKFIRKLNSKTEVFDQTQIQEYLDFKTKITELLTDITKKNFFKNQTTSNQMIWSLKEYRDNIIHTKQNPDQSTYFKLMRKSLDFKYTSALESVGDFMNFYKPGYIVECDCGSDI